MEPTYFSGIRVKVQKSIIVSKSVIHTKITATQRDLKYHLRSIEYKQLSPFLAPFWMHCRWGVEQHGLQLHTLN